VRDDPYPPESPPEGVQPSRDLITAYFVAC
jgi:hypothetical protein